MSSSNPYASAASPAGYAAKPKRNKWLWIGLPLLLLIIIGAVLGGVLGTQLNKDKSGSSNSGNASSGSGAQEGVIVPSGVSSINTVQATNTAANRYLAVQTDTYRLPVYATPVRSLICGHLFSFVRVGDGSLGALSEQSRQVSAYWSRPPT